MAKNDGKSRLGKTAATVTALGMLAVVTIGTYEGLRLYSYRDVIGVWTYCYGETKNAKPGMKFTKEQCDLLFIERLSEFEAQMRSCLNSPDTIPDKVYVAMLSIAYNIGSGGFCRSSMARDLNAGRVAKACDDLLRYNKAGGRVLKALTTRRKSERALCYKGFYDKVVTPVPTPPPPVSPEPSVEVDK